jgi:hypothetical protein
MGDGLGHGVGQCGEPVSFSEQPLVVAPQRVQPIVLAVENSRDSLQTQVQFAQQQDLLQARQLLVLVVAVAVGPDPGRRQQSDLVVVAQHPGSCS